MNKNEVFAPTRQGRECAVQGCHTMDHLTRLQVPASYERPPWAAENPLPDFPDLDAWLCADDWPRFARWLEREKSHGLPVNPSGFLTLPLPADHPWQTA